MQWFRMYHEARTDGKLDFLTDAKFRVWFRLMCYANEQSCRGVIPRKSDILMSVEVSKGDTTLYRDTLEVLKQLDMVSETDDEVRILHWEKRQFSSDDSKSRVNKHRKSNGHVTVMSRSSNGVASEDLKDLADLQSNRLTERDNKTLVPSAHAEDIDYRLEVSATSEEPDGAHRNDGNAKTDRPAEMSGYTQEFEAFWQVYPRSNTGKKEAFKAWNTRLRKGATSDELITSAKHYAEYVRLMHTEKRFMKHASTFLGPKDHYIDFLDGVPDEAYERGGTVHGISSRNSAETVVASIRTRSISGGKPGSF